MAASKRQRNHYEFDVVIDGVTLPEESVTSIDQALQKAAAVAIASLDLRGKELVLSPIMARMISEPDGAGDGDGDGDGDGPAGGAQIAIRPMIPGIFGSREGGIGPFATQNMAVIRSQLVSTKASGVEGIRISRVKGDLHFEQLDARGQTVIEFVMHPTINKAREVTALEITRTNKNGESSPVGRREKIALAVIVDELSQLKQTQSGPVVVVWDWGGFWHAVGAGLACGAAAVEGGANPIADADCAIGVGEVLQDMEDDDDDE